jgi:ABC-2 type transport system ATP-binding protein
LAAISLTGVTKNYGRARGIVDVDLSVGEGEVFGYLGPNGAGKTTTIRLLLDLIRPTTGTVQVLGHSPKEPKLRHQIGYLAGELDLYDKLTGTELLTYFDHLRGNGTLPYAHEIAERLKLDLTRPIGKLSKGNKQKVGVVQALMHKPKLLVLDEPTSGLDPLVQEEFYAMAAEHCANGGTVFLSSHVLSEVERIANRVGIIREGKIVEVATLAELRAKAVREFEVSFDEDVSVDEFAAMPNLTDVRMHGRILSCRVTGSVDPFIKVVAAHKVANFISQGADLEALFLAYYRGDNSAS